ncbi:MAG TPA: pitrilysin family protein [Vicinamibacterales bacterium]|nr:pitrilysin family protein [Vicinamibacterales bacterium]
MRTLASVTALVLLVLGSAACARPEARAAGVELVTLDEPGSPFVAFNAWIKAGSQNDPKGKEGLAALTASLIAEGATRANPYQEILAKLYPMAGGYSSSVDKEMTVFTGRIHRDHLDAYYALFKDALLAPAFSEDDFARLKSETLNYLRQARRFSNDEELSKELLFWSIYRGTPYEHPEEGYVQSVESITLEDARQFYARYYTRDNVVAGVGGGLPQGFPDRVRQDFGALPAGTPPSVPKPEPAPLEGMRILIVEKNTRATPISFGFPIALLRSDPDFYAMMLANSWFGEHRTSVSHLYQVIREARGMNYGDYSYIEAYPQGYATQVPPTNVSRRSQIFEVWIRPIAMTDPGTLHDRSLFAFRAALRELSQLVEGGLTADQFETQRRYLANYHVNFASTLSRRLAYRLDDLFYGLKTPGFVGGIRPGLAALTRDQVNAAIRRHLQAKNMTVVFITQDAEGMKQKILSGAPTPIRYAGEQPKEVLEEDRIIASWPIPVKPDQVTVMGINAVFEK